MVGSGGSGAVGSGPFHHQNKHKVGILANELRGRDRKELSWVRLKLEWCRGHQPEDMQREWGRVRAELPEKLWGSWRIQGLDVRVWRVKASDVGINFIQAGH